MNDIFFSRQNICNLRKFQGLSTLTKNTVNFGTETISYRGPRLWNLIPGNIKSEPTLEQFKKKIRKWKCEPCPRKCVKPICNVQTLSANKNISINFANGSY